ncbi:NAD-dependent epimerase/dehydratase family protein [Aquabacterium sp. OR-4]|uniref:NAD-dependent epimerase/dehydratase family protein n=1 Tax=Aquabacterium sp. OR-4 TaxID=2978127 RepID=UPI0028C803A0|nr:NAD-dependent epimerase/dehydratase family protein [Aquabacterium sp. OR-4]MDT7839066.1 NAD-dependent epimerase/dehydratase family protein [Aquabacterium sp. OR-4]
MNLFVTGASGYIGGTLARSLMADGHRVRGLTRSAGSAQRLAALGITPVVATLDDTALLAHEARAADAVVHTASADHAPSIDALIEALAGSGKALVHTSGASVVGDDARGLAAGDRVVDEDSPIVVSAVKQARRDIDLRVLAAAARGIRSVVICPSLIYGTGRGLNPHSVQIPFLAEQGRALGRVPMVGTGAPVWSNVHLDDVVDLYHLALNRAPAGAFYYAENGEASFAELARAIAQRLGLPGTVAVPADEAAARWGVPRAHFSLGSNCRVRAARARRELGWAPQHASVFDWIASELPLTSPPSSSA